MEEGASMAQGNFIKGRKPNEASREMNARAAFNHRSNWVEHPIRNEKMKCYCCGGKAIWHVKGVGYCMNRRGEARRANMKECGLI